MPPNMEEPSGEGNNAESFDKAMQEVDEGESEIRSIEEEYETHYQVLEEEVNALASSAEAGNESAAERLGEIIDRLETSMRDEGRKVEENMHTLSKKQSGVTDVVVTSLIEIAARILT